MSRQTLPQTLQSASEIALFPTLQEEMIRFSDQFKTSFSKLDDAVQPAVAGTSFPAIDVVEEGAVRAELADGILKLTIAKPSAGKAALQKINIKKS